MKNSTSLLLIVAMLGVPSLGCGAGGPTNVADNASQSEIEDYKAMIKAADEEFANEFSDDTETDEYE